LEEYTVLTVYSAAQRHHRPAYVVKGGERSPSYDVPERVDSILAAMGEAGLGPVIAPDDAGLEPIRAVHDAGMVDYLATAYARQHRESGEEKPVFPTFFPPPGQRRRPVSLKGLAGLYCTSMGVPIDEHTWPAAVASAHCAVTGAAHLRAGEPHVYALCRPPGHHAGPDFFGGYCYLSNAAIAVRTLRAGQDQRVAVLDTDYHHGNGTQAIFYADPDTWYGSVHIDPSVDYPFYAGYADETGVGIAKGTTCNVPLPPRTDEEQYLSALDSLLERLVAFGPRWLIVSAGFDTYVDDPVGTFQVTTGGFCETGRRLGELAIPTLVVQEGGYCTADLGRNVVAFLKGLAGQPVKGEHG
jgi:acetoin utilization deacetylase AcuC-like enzyme